jgi:SAM-dependent methyltransferase
MAALPARPNVTGLGFSDPEVYAKHLRRATTYTESWFHQEPWHDVRRLETFQGATYDYIVCSEVLEHIDRPVEPAFDTLFALLKPGGLLVLSVPTTDGSTAEHFPELAASSVEHDADGWVFRGTHPDGRSFEARDLVFHGGPGSTLEMRVFGRDSLRDHLSSTGFTDIRELDEERPEVGLVWHGTPESGRPPGVFTARRP